MPLSSILPFLRNRILGNVVGFGLGGAMARSMEGPFAELSAQFWRQFPNQRLPADTAAAAVVRGILSQAAGANEASETGIDGDRFDTLVRLSGSPPGLSEILDLWRRGRLSEEDAQTALVQSGIKSRYIGPLMALRRIILSPGTAAAMVAESVITLPEGKEIAALGGVTGEDFESMVVQTENPPAPGEILDLLNRGELSEAEARTALRRGGIEPRYVDSVLALRNVQPGPQDLIRFMVREVFNPGIRQSFGLDSEYPAEATALGRKIGLPEETMKQYWAAHWDLPSPEQGFRMFHRSIIDRQRLEQLLKALDFMPGWRDEMIRLAYVVPGRIDLRRMFIAGVRTRAQTKRGYLDLGYSPEDAEILTDFATAEKLTRELELSKAEIIRLYEIRALTRAQAGVHLRDLGYDEGERTLILQLADYRNAKARKDAVVAAVKSHFIAGRIGELEATEKLDEVGVAAAERDFYLDLWQWEQVLRAPDITVAQMQQLLRRGEMTRATFIEHLKQRGYSEQEAEWLAILAFPATAPAQRKVTPSELRSLLNMGKITEGDFRAAMADLGYMPKDIDRQVQLAEKELTVPQWQKLLKIEEITEAEFLAEMQRRGYSDEEARQLAVIARPAEPQPTA